MKTLTISVIISACLAISSLAKGPTNDLIADELISGSGPMEYEAGLSVTNVRNFAFSDNRNIVSIRVDEAVSVGTGAFRGCVRLETVSLPKVADISRLQGIFSGCVKLTNVYLGAIDFTSPERMNGFPWGAPNSGIIFHFRNGDFDRFGRKLN